MMTFVGAALVEVCSSLTPPAAHDAPISHLHSFANCPGTNTCSLQTTLQILKHKNQHQKAAKKTPWTRHHDVSNSTPHPSAHATPLGLLFSPQDPKFFWHLFTAVITPYPNHHGRAVDLLRNRVDVGLCCATNMAFSDSVPTLHLPRVWLQSNVARCRQTWLRNFSLDFFCGKINGAFMELIGGWFCS